MRKSAPLRPYRLRGLSLIELMIALVLGLLVVGAAIAIFLSNRQTYRATEGLARVQENVRTSFELMARDLREASGNPCVNNVALANVLNNSASRWYTNLNNWSGILVGYAGTQAFSDGSPPFGTAAGNRVSGTDAIQLLSGGGKVATIQAHDAAGGKFTLNRSDAGYAIGELLMACNGRQASVFQATGASGSQVAYSASGNPGNCDGSLGLTACTGTSYEYSVPNSVLTNLNASRWYVGYNGRNGGKSLYQSRLQITNGVPGIVNEEILEGVNDLDITYLLSGRTSYVDALGVGEWGDVLAIRLVLTLESMDKVGTDGNPITRQLIQVVSLRNRNA